MYKSKLQELCRRRSWDLPNYSVVKDGPHHMPIFTASVTVHGQVFDTPAPCKSSKEAQNACAHVAFDNLNALQQIQGPSTSTAAIGPEMLSNATQTPPLSGTLRVYKNQLQQYAQHKHFDLPVYTTKVEGPLHSCRFKSSVSVDGKSYETSEFFTTVKEAEQAAARVACQVLLVDANQEDGGIYKNLLQELAQKKGLLCPMYENVISGLSHDPSIVSTVKIGSRIVVGARAKTKKQAEINAAKAGYRSLMEENSIVPSISESDVANNFSQNVQPSAIVKENRHAAAEEAQPHAKRAKSSGDNSLFDDTNNLQPRPVEEQQAVLPFNNDELILPFDVKQEQAFCQDWVNQ